MFQIFIVSAYAFERVLDINCSPGENATETLKEAKSKCKNNPDCIGVYQKNCDDDTSYECLKNSATSSSGVQINGCYYKKFAIGTWFLKYFLSMQAKYNPLL